MSKSKDFYEILGVGTLASDKEIRSAYLELAKKHHPDLYVSGGRAMLSEAGGAGWGM